MPPLRSSTRGQARRARPARLSLALAAAALLGVPGAATAATERAKVETDRTSARLVLEWPRPIDYTVSQTGAYVFVRFSRPFAGTLDRTRAPLARYLAELRLAGGGRVLVMRLAGEPRFAHQRRGNTVVLTLIGAAPPAKAMPVRRPSAAENPTDSDDPPPPSRAGAAPPALAPRSTGVVPREPPRRPAAPPEMRAERPAGPKAGAPALKTPVAERARLPDRPSAPPGEGARAEPSSSGAPSGPAPMAPGAETEGARPRPSVPYTDALLPPARPAAPPARTGRPAGPLPERAPPSGPAPKSPGAETGAAPPPRPAAPPELRVERPAVAPPEAQRPAAPAAPRAEEARPVQSMAKAPEAERPKPEIRPAPEARPAPEGPLEPPVMPAISPTLSVTSDGAETRIVLAWPEPVAAAVFRHGDYIWIVFPRREAFDLQKAQSQLGPGVERLARLEHAQATVLTVRARPDIRVRVTHERNVWTIALKRDNAAPALPEVRLAISRNGVEQAALPLPGAETPIRIVPPGTGSILHVVPSRATAAAGGGRAFVTFRIVPAAQGGVIEALADGLVVGAESGAITIRRGAGLLLSNDGPPGSAQHGQ